MTKRDVILKRQVYNTRFKNEDMDFTFNWLVGISQLFGCSTAQLFYTAQTIQDGDPTSWCNSFRTLAEHERMRAAALSDKQHTIAAGQAWLGAAYAYRAVLQYTDPTTSEFPDYVQHMEHAFAQGMRAFDVPLRAIDVPFEDITLPGYYIEHDATPRPTVIMIGGGDTFREDLFYFAGYPGWKRGYNVLMVDLPGQGKVPSLGHHFRVDMERPIETLIDWLDENAQASLKQLAIYGVSGGGYFTAQATAAHKRIQAWVASTPIFDIAEVFRKEFRNVLKAPGWLLNNVLKIVGSLSSSTQLSLNKYAWQFGTNDFKGAVDRVFQLAQPVSIEDIHCPALFLMSEGEGEELKRQTRQAYSTLQQQGKHVTLRETTAAEGADAHCQLNNLRLAHCIVFDWLDEIFERPNITEQVDVKMLW